MKINYFNIMMRVINLLKKKTGYIFKVNVNESGIYVDLTSLNEKRMEEIKQITNGIQDNNTLNITEYCKEQLFNKNEEVSKSII